MNTTSHNATQLLSETFLNVSEWLKFAEQKNAALIAFNSAMSVGILAVMPSVDASICWLRCLGFASIFFLWLGAVVSLWSFIPAVRIPKPRDWSGGLLDDNLLFFGHIAKHTPKSYLDAVLKLTESTDVTPSRLDKQYAEQIVTNAQIAMRKYNLFADALWLTLSAFLTPLIYVVRIWCSIKSWGSSR